MLNIIFIDLDGTILDGKDKHYKCYIDIIKNNGEPLEIEEYWNLKRKKTSLDLILQKSKYKYSTEKFLKEWYEKIESYNYMKYDKLKPEIESALNRFVNFGYKIILVTKRRNKKNLVKQLNELGISKYFHDVYCNDFGVNSKIKMVKDIDFDNALFIGDTEEDIETAKYLDIKSIAVMNGIREKKFLYKADYYYDEVKDIDCNVLT
ncbi:MAG: HAD family hydrolase [Clostridiaceae bacterium]